MHGNPSPPSTSIVVLGSSETGLAVVRDARHLGLQVTLCDRARGCAFWSHLPQVKHLETDERNMADWLMSAAVPQALLIGTGDEWLRWIARHRSALTQKFTILHSSPQTLEICMDKQKFAQWTAQHGVDSPHIRRVTDSDSAAVLRFPLLLRPDKSRNGRSAAGMPKVAVVADAAELAQWQASCRENGWDGWLSESLLGKNLVQYSVPFVRVAGGFDAFVARKIWPPPDHCAVGSYVATEEVPRLLALVRRMADLLDFHGIGEVEILHCLDEGLDHVIEINARPWLQFAIARPSGHDFLAACVAPTRPIGLRQTLPTAWVETISWAIQRNRIAHAAGRILPIADAVGEWLRANVHAHFRWTDPLPGLHRALLLLSVFWGASETGGEH